MEPTKQIKRNHRDTPGRADKYAPTLILNNRWY